MGKKEEKIPAGIGIRNNVEPISGRETGAAPLSRVRDSCRFRGTGPDHCATLGENRPVVHIHEIVPIAFPSRSTLLPPSLVFSLTNVFFGFIDFLLFQPK